MPQCRAQFLTVQRYFLSSEQDDAQAHRQGRFPKRGINALTCCYNKRPSMTFRLHSKRPRVEKIFVRFKLEVQTKENKIR